MAFLKFDMRHKGPPSRAPGMGGGGCVCVGLFTTWGCHTDRLTLADMVFISLHSLPCLLSFTSTKSWLHSNCGTGCGTRVCHTHWAHNANISNIQRAYIKKIYQKDGVLEVSQTSGRSGVGEGTDPPSSYGDLRTLYRGKNALWISFWCRKCGGKFSSPLSLVFVSCMLPIYRSCLIYYMGDSQNRSLRPVFIVSTLCDLWIWLWL